MAIRRWLIAALAMLLSASLGAQGVALNPNHPDRYVVQRGDTLWDISSMFLRDPWRWPEIWHINPQVQNPHLIYPGDTLVLAYDGDGKPVLTVEPGSRGTVKLSPRVRETPLREAIPAIPIDAIQQFLNRSRVVVSKEELDNAPYIVESVDGHLITGTGNRVYVRSIPTNDKVRYSVYRSGTVYKRPSTEEVLGYEALYVGDASLEQPGDPATLALTRTVRETLIGDRLFPTAEDDQVAQDFYPRPPEGPIEGQIISLIDAVSRIGQYQIAVLDRGTADGLEPGMVLAAFRRGELVRDVVSDVPDQKVQLPDERSGLLMVFRTFDRVSYALVMNATRAIKLYDTVRSP